MLLYILHKAKKKLMKLRLQPIRVFCFHQVSETFDASTMWECDWTQINQFKRNILRLKGQYEFIALEEALEKLKHDIFRCKKYAVLTADDGWDSLKNIVPWLVENGVPITLFVNPAYLDGKHYQERESEKLLTKQDLQEWSEVYKQYISIASHGWNHRKVTELSVSQFEQSVIASEKELSDIPTKIPYFAFTYGIFTLDSVDILRKHNLRSVLVDGGKNYKDDGYIHRECIDGLTLNEFVE